MAIKYYSVPESGKTVGILNGTRYDVVNKIEKMCGGLFVVNYNKYMLPNQIREVAKTFDSDVFNEEEGKRIVKKKIMDRYYKMHDAKIAEFYNDLCKYQKTVSEYIEKNSSVKS